MKKQSSPGSKANSGAEPSASQLRGGTKKTTPAPQTDLINTTAPAASAMAYEDGPANLSD